jgi:hypothetical protein
MQLQQQTAASITAEAAASSIDCAAATAGLYQMQQLLLLPMLLLLAMKATHQFTPPLLACYPWPSHRPLPCYPSCSTNSNGSTLSAVAVGGTHFPMASLIGCCQGFLTGFLLISGLQAYMAASSSARQQSATLAGAMSAAYGTRGPWDPPETARKERNRWELTS